MLLVCLSLALAAPVDLEPVSKLVADAIKAGEARGASLLVMIDGKVVLRRGYGNLSAEDEARIASSTKPTTATALMTLVDAGKLSLDDPISKHLPELAGTASEKATVRQMLSHTAGIPAFYPGGRPSKGSLADFSKLVAREGRLFAPGRFAYGGVGIDLAARICEVASGKPYEKHFEEEVLKPLGMKKTRFTMAADPKSVKDGEGRWVSAGGGLSSTLDDLAAFYRMHLDGGVYDGKRVLSEKSVREMHSRQSSNPRETGFGKDYGLGFYLDRDGKTISHGGALGTMAWADKDRKLVGVMFVPPLLGRAAPLMKAVQKKLREVVPEAR
jgi:CubicO group peptidase (beta-lactamase class C family)